MLNIAITKKGEAYTARHGFGLPGEMPLAPLRHFTPYGIPQGIEPSAWRQAIRERIDAHLEAVDALMAALDAMTSDPDLEPCSDFEPWLGWVGNGARNEEIDDDRELDSAENEVVNEDDEDSDDDCCQADEMTGSSQMSFSQKAAAADEARRLLAQAEKWVL